MNNFELIFIGDACPAFKNIISSDWFGSWKHQFEKKGNHLVYVDNAEPGRDYGARITNLAIKLARGHYFCFADNDDKVLSEHMDFYYNSIIKTGCDFVYNPVMMNLPDGLTRRYLELRSGAVGHAELIVKTSFLRKMPKHKPFYGQDWTLIENMMKETDAYQKGSPEFPTYLVMSMSNYKEPGFENDN